MDSPLAVDEIATPEPSGAIDQLELQYVASWKVLHRLKEKGSLQKDFTVRNSSGSGRALSEAHLWAESLTDGPWIVKRTKAIAYYRGLPTKEHYENDVRSQSDYEAAVSKAFAWHRREKTDIRINLVIHMETVLPLSTRYESPAINETPAPSQRARTTATARQLQQLEETVLEGDNSVSLRAQWTCSQTACPNNSRGGYCYWIGSDSAENHYPITQEVITAWTREIKDNQLTIDKPSLTILHRLSRAKELQQRHSYSHKKASKSAAEPAGQSVIQQFFGYGIEQLPRAAIAAKRSPTPIAEPPSSQPSITTPMELMEQFFGHCCSQHRWLGLQDDLDTIRTTLFNEGFDIQGIERLSKEDWQLMDLKRGQFEKLKESLRKWKLSRRATG